MDLIVAFGWMGTVIIGLLFVRSMLGDIRGISSFGRLLACVGTERSAGLEVFSSWGVIVGTNNAGSVSAAWMTIFWWQCGHGADFPIHSGFAL